MVRLSFGFGPLVALKYQCKAMANAFVKRAVRQLLGLDIPSHDSLLTLLQMRMLARSVALLGCVSFLWLCFFFLLVGMGFIWVFFHVQEQLFKVAGLAMVDNCMIGYNSCMFAYGQVSLQKLGKQMFEWIKFLLVAFFWLDCFCADWKWEDPHNAWRYWGRNSKAQCQLWDDT